MVQRKIEVIIMSNGISVQLGTYTGDNIFVNKEPALGDAVPCEMMNTDMLNPSIKLSAGYKDANYVYIPAFSRYYYVSRPETLPGGHCILHCHVDVLKTYGGGVMGTEQLVARNEKEENWNKNQIDNLLPIKARKKVYSFPFGDAVTTATTVFSKYLLGVL